MPRGPAHEGYEDERQCGPQWPVERNTELTLDHASDHLAVGATDELRRHIVTGGDDETERERSVDAHGGQRQGDPECRGDSVSAEIARGLDDRRVNLDHRCVHRQDRERKEDVDERDDSRGGTEEKEAQWLVDQVEILERCVDDSVVSQQRPPGVHPHHV